MSELIAELCPDGVEYRALGDVGTFMRGSSFQKKHFVGEGVPCIHYGQVHTQFDIATDYTVAYLDEGFAANMRRAKPGDLIIATTSEDDDAVGKAVAWLGESDVVVSNDAYIYRHELEPKYMAYFFASELFQEPKRHFITGTKVRRINDKSMSRIRIPVPPIEVQREVVRILDEYTAAHDELVEQLGQEIELVSKQCEIALVHLNDDLVSRGYPFEPLGDHADVLSGFPFKSSGYVDEGVPVCGGVSIMPGYVDWTTCRYWPSAENLDQFTLKSDDIVMALDRPWVSGGFKLAQISEDDEGALLVQRTARIRGKDMIQAYVRSLMEMDAFRKHCAATGNTVPHVSHKKIKSYMVPVPPIDEQENYVRKACGITLATNAIVKNLIIERAYREQQLNLVRNHLLSFPEKVS